MASFTLEVMSKLHKGDARRLRSYFVEHPSHLTHLTFILFIHSSCLVEAQLRSYSCSLVVWSYEQGVSVKERVAYCDGLPKRRIGACAV